MKFLVKIITFRKKEFTMQVYACACHTKTHVTTVLTSFNRNYQISNETVF